MKISELRQKLEARKPEKKETVINATITFTDSGGNKRVISPDRSTVDPYWDRRETPDSQLSPFRASLRHHAEKSGRRVTPPKVEAVEEESGKSSWPSSTGQLADFFEAIDEASERFASKIPCAYCGASGTDKSGCCAYCAGVMSAGKMTSIRPVHTAGSKLDLEGPPHKIFVVDDIGITRAHYIQQRTDGRTLINMDGEEIEV